MTNTEKPKESSLQEQHPVEVAQEGIKIQEATATGNDKISIIDHKRYVKYGENNEIDKAGVELSIKNISDTTIGSAIFEAEFYDRNGNIIDKVEHSEFDLQPHNKGRTIYITSSRPEHDKIESYNVRLVKSTIPPTPTATGNEKIAILKHRLSVMQVYADEYKVSADMVIKNISDSTIATMQFEADFFDRDGNIIEKVHQKDIDLQPKISRRVIISSQQKRDFNEIRSYSVKIIKMTTADIEKCQLFYSVKTTKTATADIGKCQLCKDEMGTTENGEAEIKGYLKNISNVQTDAAIVATFFNKQNEKIGTKVIVLKDIEPRGTKHFNVIFKPKEGDIIGRHDLQPVFDIESV